MSAKAECSLGGPRLGKTHAPSSELGPAQRIRNIQPGPCVSLPSRPFPQPGLTVSRVAFKAHRPGDWELSLTGPQSPAGNRSLLCTIAQPGDFLPKETCLVTCHFICKQEKRKCTFAPQIAPPSPSIAAYGEPISA